MTGSPIERPTMATRKLLLATFALAASLSATDARAQVYPSRPVTVVVPFAAGGTTDVITRIMAEPMRTVLRQPVIVENIVGAGGSIAVGRAARATPDGYTLVMGHWGTHVVNGATYELPYDVRSAFEPISLTAANRQL